MSPQGLSAVAALDGSSSLEPPRRLRDTIFLGAGGGGSGGAIQALLTELSGLSKPRGFINKHVRRAFGFRPKPPPKFRILVILATNMPDVLDPALMRPGRIDRIYKVGYPSKAGRIRTYDGYLSKIRHDVTAEQIEKLATITPYATGATIKDLVNEALINSIREGRSWVTWKDVIHARLLKQLGPPEDVEYIERERHATAIHEAAHAVVAYRIRRHMTIDIATIEKGQSYLGMVQSIPLEEQFTNWRSEYEADLMVGLAGIAGERMFFDGDQSSGVSGDLHSATTLALAMEGYWGMGSTLGAHSATKAKIQNIHVSAEDGVDRSVLESRLGKQVEVRLNDVYRRTWRLLEQNRKEVLAVAHALETHKTLTGDDVGAVIEGRMGTLIDGTPYGDDEFIHMAERYHESALAAHRDHAPIASDLPIMTTRNGSGITDYRDADLSEFGDD